MRTLSSLIGEAVANATRTSDETTKTLSLRVFKEGRALARYIASEAKVSPGALCKLMREFHITLDKELAAQWLLGFAWEKLDQDGRAMLEPACACLSDQLEGVG